jgi:hypothetical protein
LGQAVYKSGSPVSRLILPICLPIGKLYILQNKLQF